MKGGCMSTNEPQSNAEPREPAVRPLSKEESSRLIEPWLGTGLALDDLPVPRIIVVRIASGAAPDFEQLRKMLVAEVPSATLDDHRGFVDRMRVMAQAAVLVG